MIHRNALIAGALALLTIGAGCGARLATNSAMETEAVADSAEASGVPTHNFLAAGSPAAKAGSFLTLAAIGQIQPDRYLIRNATVTLEVDDPETTATDVTNAASEAGGYIGGLQQTTDGLGRRTVTMTVRLPANQFDGLMTELAAHGKVLHKQIATEDVTEEYVDTEAHSRNLKVSEERIIEHLGRAGTLEDILNVERELTRVRQQIEQLDGRIRYLSHRIAFSTINVTLQSTPSKEPILPAETFSIGKNFSEAARALTGLGQRILVALIWVGVWSPVWGGALLVAIAVRRVRRNAAA